jgi:hypothetical protein
MSRKFPAVELPEEIRTQSEFATRIEETNASVGQHVGYLKKLIESNH